MSEPAVSVTIIICAAVILLTGMLLIFFILRGRRRAAEEAAAADASLRGGIDAAADAALDEINKTARLITDELTEKYQAMLFLYNLIEEKKKELVLLLNAAQSQPPQPAPKPRAGRRGIENPKQNKVIALHNEGLPVAEIAKNLKIGQGEVKLILDLAGR